VRSGSTHLRSLVLAQRQVPGKTNEIPMVTELLADLRAAGHELANMVFTLDALHTQHNTAALLHGAGAGYVMTVKANQPTLLSAVQDRLRDPQPTGSRQFSRGHGRTEQRTLTAVPATGIGFPGAQQIFRIVRYTGGLDGQRIRKEVVYGITNLSADQADAAQLAELVRGHWSIENSVHHVRDVTYREDASRVRTGNAPAVLAAIRNAVTTALRLAGALNIAAARRTATLNPRTIVQLLTRRRNQDKAPP
jgi:predicted transposase YbfD/YdcC